MEYDSTLFRCVNNNFKMYTFHKFKPVKWKIPNMSIDSQRRTQQIQLMLNKHKKEMGHQSKTCQGWVQTNSSQFNHTRRKHSKNKFERRLIQVGGTLFQHKNIIHIDGEHMFCFNFTAMDNKKEWSNAQVLANGSLESVNECTSKEVVSMTRSKLATLP